MVYEPRRFSHTVSSDQPSLPRPIPHPADTQKVVDAQPSHCVEVEADISMLWFVHGGSGGMWVQRDIM